MKKKILMLILVSTLFLTLPHQEYRAGEDDIPDPIGKPYYI